MYCGQRLSFCLTICSTSSVSRKRAASAFVGTGGLQRVPQEFLARVKIPLPTLSEQQRIVDVLRQAEILTQLRQQFENLLTRAKRQLFVEMFGDPNPRSDTHWPIVKLGSAVTVSTGGTPSREQPDSYGGAIAWVKSTDLTDEPILHTGETLTDLGVQRSNVKVCPKNTILLAMYGQGQTRGRTGKLLINAGCNQACAALLPSEKLLPDYLWVWFQLSYDAVRALARGGQQENLNLDIVRDIKLPSPPIALQQEFSRRLRQLLDVVNTTQTAKRQTEALLAAVRVNALTGDATAEWRQKHSAEIFHAAHMRDVALRERGAKVSTRIAQIAPREGTAPEVRQARQWLLDELSEFQRRVFSTFVAYAAEPLLADDPDMFAAFCADDTLTEQLTGFSYSPDRIRRTLSQLAALGLIARITLPHLNPLTLERQYLKAFRPLRDDEHTQFTDVEALRRALSPAGEVGE
ncbi:MAG TPA: restriction endonuclease subunit S [Rhodocyclaceae bacterium]|nr:restriction endonuclease subunit S [Rhodocyclaceae bacterium]